MNDTITHSTSLHSLLDHSCICYVLGQQITNLYIYVTHSDDIEQVTTSVARLSSIFKRLKHFYININMNERVSEPIVLSMFDQLTQ